MMRLFSWRSRTREIDEDMDRVARTVASDMEREAAQLERVGEHEMAEKRRIEAERLRNGERDEEFMEGYYGDV